MDDREKLMELCRYYKGEKENPYKGEKTKLVFGRMNVRGYWNLPNHNHDC